MDTDITRFSMYSGINEEEVRLKLETRALPGLRCTIGELNLIRSVNITDSGLLHLEMAAPSLNDLARQVLKVQISRELKQLPGVLGVKTSFVESKPPELNAIQNVIAVMSGKGGVGKSLVSALLAVGLKRMGKRAGILDADITGPSIPRMFGLTERPVACQEGLLPALTSSGIAVMSINLLLDSEDGAVIWRGPLIAKAITQFYEEVFWGKLDYLIVDLPPGTADAPLTVIKSLPVSGLVIVSTPQELSTMIVRKAVSMARSTGTRILGVVENMSYLYLADIDRRVELFGPSRATELAEAARAPVLAQIPVETSLARMCDGGLIEEYESGVIAQLARGVYNSLAPERKGRKKNDGK
jgi:Mrp family chromosome partitioning ATPase